MELDKARVHSSATARMSRKLASKDPNSSEISQAWLWENFGLFLQSNDTVVVDSGTAQFGIADTIFPASISFITQLYFGSIGYAVPACLGAAVAKREECQDGRVVLIVGDGSLQLTAQEIGTMIKLGLKNILMLVSM